MRWPDDSGLDDATRTHLKKKVQERRKEESAGPAAGTPNPVAEVDAALRAGKLNDVFIAEAAEACHKDTVARALCVLAKIDEVIVRRILESGSARAVTALAWRAGLGMRIAFKLQNSIMHLSGADLLPARGGVDFPLTEDEMLWHLGYFGVN